MRDFRGFFHRHSLGIVLTAGFLTLTLYSLGAGWFEYQQDQAAHAQPVQATGFWLWWTWEYSTSILADVFGAMLLVLLTKRLREIGSAEDRDS